MSPASVLRFDLARHLFAGARPAGRAPRIVVAIPARNEAERIEACLAALAGQRDAPAAPGGAFGIVLLANNCSDDTVPRARACLEAAGLPHIVLAVDLAPGEANAGFARGLALDVASLWAAEAAGRGILLTTDADSRVPPDWIARNVAALSGPCSAVAGRFAFDAAEEAGWPLHLVRRRQVESAYEHVLDALAARLDPLPHDPWPNHSTHSGASFAVTLAAYRRIGGLPAAENGEDRALARELARHDIALRHDPGIVVTTSARFDGRASAGCASALRQRSESEAVPGDERLEALPAALRRMVLRGRLRRAFLGDFRPGDWERRLVLPAGTLAGRAQRRFGEAWSVALLESPILVARPLRPAEMQGHLCMARRVRAALGPVSGTVSGRDEQVEPVVVGALLPQQPKPVAERRDEPLGSLVA
ncbi:glycosyltransferase [Methylobrevis albus]|uniref:Glycosyltransferase n=1 Tax=Methylobrevis albus TaxID=2793297 RepID=A0A931MZQ7_9HYPH|nr:glycosyltransferase [Methylobrevis albus]MBH0238001.1 glycosyltransferase [Methylobrevis albus]